MIEIKDIEKLAALARIYIPEEEKAGLQKEVVAILAYVDQVQSASSTAGDEREVPAHRNVFREDGEPHESGIHTEALLSEAPKRERSYLKVKKIL